MLWDFAKNNVLGEAAKDYIFSLGNIVKALEQVPAEIDRIARQDNAQTQAYCTDKLISTGLPYYDNIGYADLSDFFSVWLRPSLRSIFPGLFTTLAVPKPKLPKAPPARAGRPSLIRCSELASVRLIQLRLHESF